jgi:predicted component of type VI protein secretion system
MANKLVFVGVSGSLAGQSTVFSERSTSIGSNPRSDVVMHDPSILPRHAEVRTALDRWFILPLDPKATIFVNTKQVTGQQRIDAGDLVTIGSATFKVVFGEAERAVGESRQARRSEGEAQDSSPWSEDRWRD